MRTAYSYDSAGRLEYETVTRESGGTTNLYKTQYAYAYIAAGSGGGSRVTRTEQSYSGGAWINDNKLKYEWDSLGRQNYEQRDDWNTGTQSWVQKYDPAFGGIRHERQPLRVLAADTFFVGEAHCGHPHGRATSRPYEGGRPAGRPEASRAGRLCHFGRR